MTPDPRLDHIERRLDAVERDLRNIYNGFCGYVILTAILYAIHLLAAL